MNKKIISVFLVMAMLFSGLTIVSSAANENISGVKTINSNTTIGNGQSWTVLPEGKIVIEQGYTLTIASGGSIVNHGTIENSGSLSISTGGTLTRMSGSNIYHEVRLNPGVTGQYNVHRLLEGVPTSVEEEHYFLEDLFQPYSYSKDPISETTKLWVKDGGIFCFRIVLDNIAYDVNKFAVDADGLSMTRTGTYFTLGNVNRSVDVNYGGGSDPYGEHLRKTIRIPLPGSSESGYQVVAYYKGVNYTEEVEVLYGDGFSFTVDLDPAYSRSTYTITVGGNKFEPNDDGFYVLSGITDEKAAADMYEIIVVGVMANETLDMFSNIFAFLKQIMETIMDVFKTFFGGDLFGGLGGGE